MSRARTLAGAIGSDGALNVADVAGLAAVASSGSASDLSTGTLPIARIADGAVTAAKLANSGFELGFKNLLINGDARVSQRNQSTAVTAGTGYAADRWYMVSYDNSWNVVNSTIQRVDMPAGTLLGGEYFNGFMRVTPGSSATRTYIWQHIENLAQFDSRTITLSYWARVGSGTFSPGANAAHRFEFIHDSASTTTDVYGNAPTYTTSWQKFITTITVPSFSGKTFGVNNCLSTTILSAQDFRTNSYFDFTGVQLEFGSVATPFERRHIGIETSLCHRYCFALGNGVDINWGIGRWEGTAALIQIVYPQQMRAAPTFTLYNVSGLQLVYPEVAWYNVTSLLGVHKNGTRSADLNFGTANAGGTVPGKTFAQVAVNFGSPMLLATSEL